MLKITRLLRHRPVSVPSLTQSLKLNRGGFTKRYSSSTNASLKQSISANAPESSGEFILAGAVGGLTALVGGYAWYHFSGTKKVIQTARSMIDQLDSAKMAIASKSPSQGEIVTFLSSNLKPYLTVIPGASAVLDELDEISQAHGDELNSILLNAYNDLKEVVVSGGMDQQTAQKMTDIARRLASQLQDLSKNMGQKLLDDQPQVKEWWEHFKTYLEDIGPEAENLLKDTEKQLQGLLKPGRFSISAAYQTLDEKAREAKKLARKAAEKAWEKGAKELKPYMDKLPEDGDEVKRVVHENLDSAKKTALAGGLPISKIPHVFQKVQDLISTVAASQGGSDRDKLNEAVEKFKKYFEDLKKQSQERRKGLGKFFSDDDN